MARYLEGDVVLCRFPFQENPTLFKIRPGVILRIEMVGTVPYFHTAKITGTTDLADYFIGKLIEFNCKANRSMHLDGDSFIHLQQIARLPLLAIMRRIGTCPIIDELKELCKKNAITHWLS